MSKTRPSIHLNDGVLSILWTGVEGSCEPPEVNTCCLLVLLVCGNVGGSHADSSPDGVPPLAWRHRPKNQCAVNGKTKDHGDVLQCQRDLSTWKAKPVGLVTPPVHKCRQRGRVHHQQTVSDEASKQQETCTAYEWCVPLIPRAHLDFSGN
jgi:hypothetical protein